jgi:diguanylate cyclase (GGDEF)-like protein/PAS domain S-box-containing protein
LRENDLIMNDLPAGPDSAVAGLVRDAAALIIAVDDAITGVLGWLPEQLLGRPSTDFIHPEDQPSAVAAWFEMIEAPGETRTWQGRYRTSEGTWKWVECVNVNMLADPDSPVVRTTMRHVAVDQVSLAEELRARKQLLSRLSDAMPVGMFQIDTNRTITYTNDRLHVILGDSAAASIEAHLSIVDQSDRTLLDRALSSVLGDQAVDDIELRFLRASEDGSGEERVCVLSMRPLSDSLGDVTGAVGCVSDVTAQVELRRQLEMRANTDELTGCFNRPKILEVLSLALRNQRRSHGGVGVTFIDLCGFKLVNDRFGHAAGDRVLNVAGTRLRSTVRQNDQVGRFGGDEFLVVSPNVGSAQTALEVAQRIHATLTEPVNIDSDLVELRASVGVAWSAQSCDVDTLVAHADLAMYQTKSTGSSTAALFESSDHQPS